MDREASAHQPAARPTVPVGIRGGAVIGVALLMVWIDGARQWFVPCAADCGETFDAIQYAAKYRLYGFRYGLVQDMSTSAEPQRFPLFYTHNVNVGGIGFAVLEALGVTSLWAKQLVTLLGFGAGLAYVFRATAYHTRSAMVGALVVACFAADYHHVLSFGLNALRAWHWLAIFGLLFHVARYVREAATRVRDRVVIGLLGGLSFGIGYDFWVVCLSISLVMLRGRCAWPVVARGRTVADGGLDRGRLWSTGPATAGPDCRRARARVLGGRSVLQRRDQGIAAQSDSAVPRGGGSRPAVRACRRAAPSRRACAVRRRRTGTFRYMVRWDVLPTLGAVATVVALGIIGLGVVLTAAKRVAPPRALLHVLARIGLRGQDRRAIVGGSSLITALALGAAVGLAVFAPLSFHIYLKHQFPLVAGPVLVVKGFVLAWAVRELGRSGRHWLWRMGPVIAAGVLVTDHAIVQAEDWKARPAVDMSWIGAVRARPDSTFAVSWIPGTVAAFAPSLGGRCATRRRAPGPAAPAGWKGHHSRLMTSFSWTPRPRRPSGTLPTPRLLALLPDRPARRRGGPHGLPGGLLGEDAASPLRDAFRGGATSDAEGPLA